MPAFLGIGFFTKQVRHPCEDIDLRRFGDAAKFLCSPEANLGKPPREPFVIQLREARIEWQRRKKSDRI